MKILLAIFIAASSTPVAFLVGFIGYRMHLSADIPMAFAQGALVTVVMLLLSLVLFLWGIPSALKRLKSQHQQGV